MFALGCLSHPLRMGCFAFQAPKRAGSSACGCTPWLRRFSGSGASQLAAALWLGAPLPENLRSQGMQPHALEPARFGA